MSDIVASPFGYQLPYYALFSLPQKDARRRRPTNHFWDKAIAPFTPSNAAPDTSIEFADFQMGPSPPENGTLKLSETEDEGMVGRAAPRAPVKKKTFSRMRYISFRAFTPRIGSKNSCKVASTEIIAKEKPCVNLPLVKKDSNLGRNFFKSWRIKRKGARGQVQKVAAVDTHRVSSRSPEDEKPVTWEQYNKYYGAGRIDINDPPSPPLEPSKEPTPFQKKLYIPPNADDEQTRQLVINRLSLFGKKVFESSKGGTKENQERTEAATKLEEEGRAPKTPQEGSFHRQIGIPAEMNPGVALKMTRGAQSGKLLPESLEQYHVFRKIAKQCCEIFGASASMLSIMEADRQVILAHSGLDGLREVPRGMSVCSHTVLNGRRGLSVLDLAKDWRFSSNPLLAAHGARFYAGVPLLAPNLDGSPESEKSATPLGTLCILDVKPRESFGREERKKLLYMAEYARREIGLWFKEMIAKKVAALEDSQKTFTIKSQAVIAAKEKTTEQQVEAFTEDLKMKVTATPATTQAYAIDQTRMRNKIILRGHGSGDPSSRVPSTLSTAGDFADCAPALVVPRNPSLFDNKRLSINSKIQNVLHLATVMVGSALDVHLVYLLYVTPHSGPSLTGQTSVLSEYNPLASVPSHDTQLYQRVLSAPEGGLIYQNPSSEEAQEVGLMPTSQAGSSPYISAMLVRVGPEATAKAGGVVLAGFTTDDKRVFGAEDFIYMKQFALELTHHTCQL